VMMRPRCI